MATDLHSEIEHKWSADHVSELPFLLWAMEARPLAYSNSSSCPDVYYTQGVNVVRHRWSEGAGELTVKQRKSAKNITDRVEVDLKFLAGVAVNDVTKFLIASGWKRLFTLFKDAVHVFWFQDGNATVTLSLYGVKKFNERTRTCDKTRFFVEVEVEKGSDISDSEARITLDAWRERLEASFSLGTPLNESLFEIYSGKSYTISKGTSNGNGKQDKGIRNRHGHSRNTR